MVEYSLSISDSQLTNFPYISGCRYEKILADLINYGRNDCVGTINIFFNTTVQTYLQISSRQVSLGNLANAPPKSKMLFYILLITFIIPQKTREGTR